MWDSGGMVSGIFLRKLACDERRVPTYLRAATRAHGMTGGGHTTCPCGTLGHHFALIPTTRNMAMNDHCFSFVTFL